MVFARPSRLPPPPTLGRAVAPPLAFPRQVPHFQTKLHMDEALKVSGLTYTILRPVVLMDNVLHIPAVAISAGKVPGRIPAASSLQYIDVADISRAAAVAFGGGCDGGRGRRGRGVRQRWRPPGWRRCLSTWALPLVPCGDCCRRRRRRQRCGGHPMTRIPRGRAAARQRPGAGARRP